MLNINKTVLKKYPQLKKLPKPVSKGVIKTINKIVHKNEIDEFLKEFPQKEPFTFIEEALEKLNFSYKYTVSEIENIPVNGRIIIIANHPTGILDTFCLIDLVKKVRKDIKVMANNLLLLEQLKSILIGVDNFDNKITKASLSNINKSLHNEEAVIIFPSGEVSRPTPTGIRDGKWHKGFLHFAKHNKAPILPVFIKAKNSKIFYSMSLINKNLSSLLLFNEMFKKKNSHLEFKIGELIPFDSFDNKIDEQYQVKLFKKHLYKIGKNKKEVYQTQKPIIHPVDKKELKDELKRCEVLGKTTDGKIIYLYKYSPDSVILKEIARLREYTFRKVGEGTGKRKDKDKYDYYYDHIILWNEDELEIVGSYRIGNGEFIYKKFKEKGFYTNTLYEFGDEFIKILPNAIELGRSFVVPKYWGSRALDLLWQGIGAYIKSKNNIRYLFGPVSLSTEIPLFAQEMIIYYFDKYYGKNKHLVKAKNPFIVSKNSLEEFNSVFKGGLKEDFNILRSYLNYYNTSIPTLYKQYTDLCEREGASFIDYNVDEDFNNCIDSFVLVDISTIKPQKKKRYL
ncbi:MULTISPECIES: lysophospholipid acyltransferase family protein [unclassified Lebetimonas]|uniref:lysophospholipid acyltransferase family protein n=1 Tax=unclassified Lebetimonas TaxID=2648158 RepID=UPI0004660095|nr:MULTISPECIES: lysophospholipid acyltransferase family protein [unclassified Lebetimonas]